MCIISSSQQVSSSRNRRSQPEGFLHTLLKRTRSIHVRRRSTTFAFVGVVVIPGIHASMMSFCSSNDLPFSSSGIEISYLRAIWARMQVLSVRAKRCPMQLRAPPEKARTKIRLMLVNTKYKRGVIGMIPYRRGGAIDSQQCR